MKKQIKRIIRFILTFPQIIGLLIRGIKIKDFKKYEEYTSFFRYFPFGYISGDGIVSFSFKGKEIKMFCDDISPVNFAEVFRMNEYGKLFSTQLIKGSDVIDIGTALGDTTVYFGIMGAKKVYGYEINPKNYNLCHKNIVLNGLEDVCDVELCGIGANSGFLDNSLTILGAIIPERDKHLMNKIKMKTLDEIVREHNIDNGILKIDVDGFEYDILMRAKKETLRSFKIIIMEYHFGTRGLLSKLIECGFTPSVSGALNVFVDYHPKEFQHMDIGYILASRN